MAQKTTSVRAIRCVRKMRGGAQAHLVEASDGRYYVVKFAQNPQGRRILVNELVSSVVLRQLGVATPEVAFVTVDDEFQRRNPECWTGREDRRIPVSAGVHFGSRYPASRGEWPIYDFLPDPLLRKVYNRDNFLGVLVADKWMSNADGRQAIFYRGAVEVGGKQMGDHWVAFMIDNGSMFQGGKWTFGESPAQGVYCRLAAYGAPISLRNFEPWLAVLWSISKSLVDEVHALAPPEWIDGGEHELTHMLRRLDARRCRVRGLLLDAIEYINARGSRLGVPVQASGLAGMRSEPVDVLPGRKRMWQPIAAWLGVPAIPSAPGFLSPLAS